MIASKTYNLRNSKNGSVHAVTMDDHGIYASLDSVHGSLNALFVLIQSWFCCIVHVHSNLLLQLCACA